MDEQQKTGWLVAKIASAWAMVGVTSWSEAASFVAFLYTSCLFMHWMWRTGLRPFFVDRGWLKPIPAGKGSDDAPAV